MTYCEENVTITEEVNTNQTIDTNHTNTTETADHELSEEEEKEQFAAFARKIMDEMVGNETHVPRDRFKVFLRKLITRGEPLDTSEEEFYNEMVDKIVERVPETIDSKEISKYIDQDYLMNILNDLIKEKYGEEALGDFQRNAENQDLEHDHEQEHNPDL
jgi:hypothetical protein